MADTVDNLIFGAVVTDRHWGFLTDTLAASKRCDNREDHSRDQIRNFSIPPGMSLAQVEPELIRQTLINVTSNRTEAAEKLGISRRALQYKIKRYGLVGLNKRMADPKQR